MKQLIQNIVLEALQEACRQNQLPSADFPEIEMDIPRLETHGDYATNVAMMSASRQKMAPRRIAEIILAHLPRKQSIFSKAEIAGPGFINFFIRPEAWQELLRRIHAAGDRYGAANLGQQRRVQVEFVSSNPTGPLHVGHGRGAVVGDAVAAILEFCGYCVQREYYINDSGRQISTLGRSVFLRGLQATGQTDVLPEDCYQGDYIQTLAKSLLEAHGADFFQQAQEDIHIRCARYAVEQIMQGIRQDLEDFGVRFDCWFSEQSLYDEGKVDAALQQLRARGQVYMKDGAWWFKTTDYGDEKDRVVVRQNGQTTYFASDIAYHQNKYARGFEWVIDVWGADHHGYIPRMRAAIEAAGYDRQQFDVILVQLVNLLRAGSPVAMSTRAGEFVTLREVVAEVGRDAARFLFLTRHHDSPLDFDLELAKRRTNDNPVYYVQYVHARIASILRKATAEGYAIGHDDSGVGNWVSEADIRLIKVLSRYPETIANAACHLEPHRVTFYLMDLAAEFHAYYNKQRVLLEDDAHLSGKRLYLIGVVQRLIGNGLKLLGVSAPESM